MPHLFPQRLWEASRGAAVARRGRPFLGWRCRGGRRRRSPRGYARPLPEPGPAARRVPEARTEPRRPRSHPPRIWALVRSHTHKLTSRLVRTHRTAPVSSGRRLPTQLPALLFHRVLPGAAGLQSTRPSPEHWPSRVPGVGWGFIYSWVKRQGWRAENPVDWPQGRSPFPERGALEGVEGRPFQEANSPSCGVEGPNKRSFALLRSRWGWGGGSTPWLRNRKKKK